MKGAWQEPKVMEAPDEKQEKRLTRTQSTFLKLFDCPVCFERIAPPVTVCVNGHGVCSQCKKQLLSCPTCKANFSQYKNTMIDQIIEETLFLCKYNERGCTVELKYREIDAHEKKHCRHRMLTCEVRKENTPCGEEVPIWEYYFHVLRNHPQEPLYFQNETHRIINISADISQTNILKDIDTQKIIFESIKLNRQQKKFYIIYQYIGLFDDSVFKIKIYSKSQKYKEIAFKNLCAPIGLSSEDLEGTDKCLILDPTFLNGFAVDNKLHYSIKIETLPKKWYEVLKDKCGFKAMAPRPHGSCSDVNTQH